MNGLTEDCSTLTETEFLEAGVIDIDPEYQREVVWTGELAITHRCQELTDIGVQLIE